MPENSNQYLEACLPLSSQLLLWIKSYFSEARIILESMGSTGNSAILRPNFVSSPLWFRAPRAYNCSSASTRVSWGGGSMKSKWMRSLIPKLFNSNTTFPKLVLWISGIVLSSSSFLYAQAVNSRKHFPAETRPARPALWLAEACN